MNFKKIQLMLGVLFVFILILATNLIDQRNFEEMQSSIKTIYEDRLVAQDIIYDLNLHIQNKDMANALQNYDLYKSQVGSINKNIERLLVKYEATKLTPKESDLLADLKYEIQLLTKHEVSITDSSNRTHDLIETQLTKIKSNLLALEQVQLEEGKRAVGKGEKAIYTSELFTNMEICGLIILAIIFQVIILTGPKKQLNFKWGDRDHAKNNSLET